MSPTEREAGQGRAAEVAAFLRALAARVERDGAFAGQIADALAESGLLAGKTGSAAPKRPKGARMGMATTRLEDAGDGPSVDPFTVYRAQGIDHLRATLESLDLPTLRIIVRTHRLDPARISARWTNRERVIDLIVDQVKARANHGRAFERV